MKELLLIVFSLITLIGVMMMLSESAPNSLEEWNIWINVFGGAIALVAGNISRKVYGWLEKEYSEAEPGKPDKQVRR